MADIFISYAREDRDRVSRLAEALEGEGFSVWWDALIASGSEFTKDTERELGAARAVIVAWSRASADSAWVRDEATVGREQGKLFAISLDGTEPPLGFRQFQATDFSGWHGGGGRPFDGLADAIRRRAGADDAGAHAAPRRTALERIRMFATRRRAPLALGAALAVVAALVFIARPALPWSAPKIATGEIEMRPFLAAPANAERNARAAAYQDAFRQRFTELGLKHASATKSSTELIVTGDLSTVDDKDVFTARIEDRRTGATLWSIRRAPSEGAAWESNIAGFALTCALKRRDPARGPEQFSRYLQGCAHFLEPDWPALYAATKAVHDASPDDPRAIAFFAFGNVALGWAGSSSDAEYARFIAEAKALAERALKLDPDNSDALFAMGFTVLDVDYAEQEPWWRRAIAADPESGWALGRYANFLSQVGRINEAVDVGERAALYRRGPILLYARLKASLGDLAGARRDYEVMRPFDPGRIGAHELTTLVLYGDVDSAAEAFAADPAFRGEDGACFRQLIAARRKEPIETSQFAEACGGQGEWSIRAYALAGDLDGAFSAAETFIAETSGREPAALFGREMRAFQRDPRFWPLALRIGLVRYWLDTDQWPDFCRAPDLPFDCKERAAAVSG